jgi:hypothetical protein
MVAQFFFNSAIFNLDAPEAASIQSFLFSGQACWRCAVRGSGLEKP